MALWYTYDSAGKAVWYKNRPGSDADCDRHGIVAASQRIVG